MAYDLNKWVENEWRSRRRWRHLPFALGLIMLMAVLTPFLEILDDGSDTDATASFLPFLLTIPALAASPFGRHLGSWSRGANDQDEFELAAVARATSHAFNIILLLIVLTFGWFWLAISYGWPMPRTPMDWSTFLVAFLTIGTVLPTFLAEVMIPLPPEGDPDDVEDYG